MTGLNIIIEKDIDGTNTIDFTFSESAKAVNFGLKHAFETMRKVVAAVIDYSEKNNETEFTFMPNCRQRHMLFTRKLKQENIQFSGDENEVFFSLKKKNN